MRSEDRRNRVYFLFFNENSERMKKSAIYLIHTTCPRAVAVEDKKPESPRERVFECSCQVWNHL